jgi:regulator of protease activity HflC (stomatin/prohibitin superfamily)
MSCQCWTCVPQGTIQVIQRWGKFDRFAQPGCHILIPCVGDDIAGALSTRIQSLDVAVETKTKDNVFVTIIVSTQYMVIEDDERRYYAFYKLTDSREQIRSYIFDVVRSTVPRIILDDVFTTKEEIASEVKSMLEKSMTEFGYRIIQTLVTDIAPDQKVKIAMNEINAAQRQRVAAQDRAEAEKIMVVKAAEADAEAKYLAGTGIARQRQAIINGLRESVMNFQAEVGDVSSKDVMEMMMMTQYFDTMKEVGCANGNSTIFVPSGPGAVAEAAAAVRTGIMQGNAAVANMKK